METEVMIYIERERLLRLAYMRSAPITTTERDLLQSAEEFLDTALPLPIVAMLRPAFEGLPEHALTTIVNIAQCTAAALHLDFAHSTTNSTSDITYIRQAGSVYLLETQRLLGSLFPIAHPFWQFYYIRRSAMNASESGGNARIENGWDCEKLPRYLQERYAMYFLIVDAMHYASECRNKLAYELLLQSLKWILAGFYSGLLGARCNELSMYKRALKLTEPLDLPEFKTWITEMIQSIQIHQYSTDSSKI
jgi:hypothetical protein